MNNVPWADGSPVAITVCDRNGIILYMNDKSAITFAKDGGRELIGRSVFDCHPEPSRSILQEMIESRKANVYTVEKSGVKKLIYQVPWYQDQNYAGFVEYSFEIPFDMPHFIRQP